jgi:carbon starvation protein CstA
MSIFAERLKINIKMISFTLSLLALIVGYLIYGKFIEHMFGPDDRPTPAISKADGVDYIVLPNWKVFMIQFLNIAGTGPIFGAIMGAWYGPMAYLWIVFGCIFAGSVHDYLCGMLSMRHGGASIPELVGHYLGSKAKNVMLVFSVFLLLMVGVVFVYSPAIIMKDFCWTTTIWIFIIFLYYILATILPIDKIIGRFYPIFAFSLLFMAVALLIGLYVKMPNLPEIWTDMSSYKDSSYMAMMGVNPYMAKNPFFPCLFLTIACGAISGFHATQSPLMARCLKSEHKGRAIFYGSMITEGVVALIWATVSMYFFYYGGWKEVVAPDVLEKFTAQLSGPNPKNLIQYFSAPTVVETVCSGWLGVFGGVIAILGVVAAPITSGDTAFRSARLIIAEALHTKQTKIHLRLAISVPMFMCAIALLIWQTSNPDGFNVLWQYFGWANQTLAVFMLWTMTVYLVQKDKPYWITLIPSLFMTAVCSTFIFISEQMLGMQDTLSYILGGIAVVVALVWFFSWYKKYTALDHKK